ncbi:hypothetical protein [Pandoraea commovens]|uniref:Translocation protein in type III secretion n=1 Tax=Pandoraea commovens TaxID=2508289 RepID=A0A5E4Z916_9BURK|nr:hypothetical protein [Pandoraea commovens]VVE57659.1 translocation protein in type III secretion [Pandoraea commovens]
MFRETGTESDHPLTRDVGVALEGVLAGTGCVRFIEGETEVCVGWLRAGGDGLVATARVDEGVVGQTHFWCDAGQWAAWLDDRLPVPSWEALPPDWRVSAASLTLATEGADIEGEDEPEREAMAGSASDTERSAAAMRRECPDTFAAPTSWPQVTAITRESVEATWRIGIVLQRGARRLALVHLDGVTSWLTDRCQRAVRCDTPLDPSGFPTRRCTLAAGWAELPASLCDRLREGGAVLLDVAADVASGEYWLLDGARAIAMCDGQPSGRHVVLPDLPTPGAVEGGAASCTRLVAVIAERAVPVPSLAAWHLGRATSHERAPQSVLSAARISLWRDGTPWANGRLLRFGDGRLAVHIDPMP